MIFIRLAVVIVSVASVTSVDLTRLSDSARTLFQTAMSYSDTLYDPVAVHLFSSDPGTPGQHDTRSSAMYVTGLLLRNGGDGEDVERATAIIELISHIQYGRDAQETPWFGTYPHAPDEPEPNSGNGTIYGTLIYGNYDPNWRDFIGTAWCLALATSEHLLSETTIKTIEHSLLSAAEGASRRFQGRGEYANSVVVDPTQDNLDEAYTNPWLMGTFLMGYIGERLGNVALVNRSNSDAQKIYDLFTYGDFNTFSEYNSPTYTGVDLYALALWVEYAPPKSKMRELGPFMLRHTLSDIATLYHAGLRNLAGPWDRTYGFDMTRYHSIVGQFITALSPKNMAAIPPSLPGSLHSNARKLFDYPCFAALNAFLSPILAASTPLDSFKTFGLQEERKFFRQVRTNTEDPKAVRNVTAWLTHDISLGAQSLDEPFARQSSMVAAVLQWILPSAPTNVHIESSPPRIGYIALSPPTASVVNAVAEPHTLIIRLPPSSRFPNATQPHSVVLAVGGFDTRTFANVDMTRGLEGIPGLNVTVETEGLGEFEVAYNASASFNGFFSYYVTYNVTAVWPDVPSLTIKV